MFEKLTDLFRSDEFIPSSEVFPNIDKERVARDLSLEEEGRKRGSEKQPAKTSKTLDHIELKAVGRVEELRRRGLDNFETNRRVYSDRLNHASSARMLVETESEDAKARFTEEVTAWRAKMATPKEDVREAFLWRTQFRRDNKIGVRPAKLSTSWPNIIGLSLVMILLEAAGNAYLFSQNNPLGILGGLIAAFLVSFANVIMCTILGMASRLINARGFRNLFKKLAGLFFCLFWFAFALGYNAAVAHFRDAVETTLEWRAAGEIAIETLIAHPVALNTMESYVLFLLGFIISIVAFWKGYTSADPYPGYSKVAELVLDAREAYVENLEDAIEDLATHRDEAVEALRQARDEVSNNIRDSVDALYGQKALQANLRPFLEQCNISANYLLAVYRDANKAAREDTPPKYFDEQYAFEVFEAPVLEDERRQEAEAQVKEVTEMVDKAIKEIFAVFHRSVQEYWEIDELEGRYDDRAQKGLSENKARAKQAGVSADDGEPA